MTKSEKKILISSLLDEVINIQELSFKEEKLSSVVMEIYSSGYSIHRIKTVTDAVNIFISDFITHKGESHFLNLSKSGIITLIDLSLLPD